MTSDQVEESFRRIATGCGVSQLHAPAVAAIASRMLRELITQAVAMARAELREHLRGELIEQREELHKAHGELQSLRGELHQEQTRAEAAENEAAELRHQIVALRARAGMGP